MNLPQLTTFIGANRVRVETQQHTLPLMGVGRGFFVRHFLKSVIL